MKSTEAARPTQTKVKHTILERYLKAWGGIIINGLRRLGKDLHFVYVDCNAYMGRYNGEVEDAIAGREPQVIWGSPIIGIQALDHHSNWAKENVGINVSTSAILFEENPKYYADLKKSLEMASLADRVRETTNFSSLRHGEIAIIHGDSTLMGPQLVNYTQTGYKFAFFFLDPFGPKGIPFTFVDKIIRHQRHDVLIYMPFFDLMKKSGLILKPYLGPAEQKILRNYNEMFGNEQWQALVKPFGTEEIKAGQEALSKKNIQTNQAIRVGDLELDLMHCYKQSLLSGDPSLVVKSIDLHFPDKDRTIYYLYLTTHDPNGALTMNKVLSEAGYLEYELKWKFKQAQEEKTGQLRLFDNLPIPAPSTPPRASIQDIGEHILRHLRHLPEKTLRKRDLYTAFADESYFPEEIDKALSSLRKQKRISYENPLNQKTAITLLEA